MSGETTGGEKGSGAASTAAGSGAASLICTSSVRLTCSCAREMSVNRAMSSVTAGAGAAAAAAPTGGFGSNAGGCGGFADTSGARAAARALGSGARVWGFEDA